MIIVPQSVNSGYFHIFLCIEANIEVTSDCKKTSQQFEKYKYEQVIPTEVELVVDSFHYFNVKGN